MIWAVPVLLWIDYIGLYQSKIGDMYLKGKGITQSDAKAVEWLNKAANQGDAAAQYSLGVIYAEGKGIPQDNTKAFEWTQKSANQSRACYRSTQSWCNVSQRRRRKTEHRVCKRVV